MTQGDFDSLAPQDALDWYLEHPRDSLRTATRRKHTSALGAFVDWTDEVDIADTNEVGGRGLMRFKTWRKNETELATISLNGTLAILRRFLRFCERIHAVAEGVAERVPMPNVPPDEAVNTDVPAADEVEGIRSYFRQFEYASRRHVEFELIAEIGLRMGAIRAIDLDALDREGLVIHLCHRPEETEDYGTPLKNGPDGERIVNISPEIRDFYKMTRPCVYSTGCPHDREGVECDAVKNDNGSECPSGFSTHPLRKWPIMNQLDAGMPKELLSDRVDVSVPVLDKHYDHLAEQQKSRRRREELEKHLAEYSSA